MLARPALPILLALVSAAASAATPSKEFRRTVPLAASGEVHLDTDRSEVRVTAWDRPEVDVFVHIEAHPESREPEESVRRAEVRLDASPSLVRLTVHYGDPITRWNGWDRHPRVRYDVKVPRAAALRLQHDRSEVDVTGLAGRVQMGLDRSNVRLAGFTGTLDVQADRGRIEADRLALSAASSVRADRTEVEFSLAPGRGLTLDLELERADADIDPELKPGSVRRDRRSASYQGPVAGGGPTLRIDASRGSVRLRRS